MPTALSRRDFLKWLSLAGAALASHWLLAGCRPGPPVPAAASSTPSPAPTQSALPTGTASPAALAQGSATPAPAREGLPEAGLPGERLILPAPRLQAGWPLMQALADRRSGRSFRQQEVPLQEIADLLWAGFGVNRPASGGRTAPSAYDLQDIAVHLVSSRGAFLYAAGEHALVKRIEADLRSATGTQAFVSQADLDLVYVCDTTRLAAFTSEDQQQWPWAHCGCIAQNVSLCCAALGLATVVRSTIDRQALALLLGLPQTDRILLAQSLGYPAD